MRRLSTPIEARREMLCPCNPARQRCRAASQRDGVGSNYLGVPYHGERSVFGSVPGGGGERLTEPAVLNEHAELPLRDACSINRVIRFGSEWC
jgi:hypothetical protein